MFTLIDASTKAVPNLERIQTISSIFYGELPDLIASRFCSMKRYKFSKLVGLLDRWAVTCGKPWGI